MMKKRKEKDSKIVMCEGERETAYLQKVQIPFFISPINQIKLSLGKLKYSIFKKTFVNEYILCKKEKENALNMIQLKSISFNFSQFLFCF